MKSVLILCFVVLANVAMAQNSSPAISAIGKLNSYIDSLIKARAVWNELQADTEYAEVPVDPNNPEVLKVDTIITTVMDKKRASLLYNDWNNGNLKGHFEKLYKDAEFFIEPADEKSKGELMHCRKRFNMIPPPAL